MSFDNPLVETIFTILVAAIGAGALNETIKATREWASGRAEERREAAKEKAAEELLAKRASDYWREMAFEVRRIAIAHGVPQDDLPDINPPGGG